MKKHILLGSLLLFLLTGCATYVEVDGNRYKALSGSQQEYLVQVSRHSLSRQLKKGLVTRAECNYVMRNQPEIRIQYRGDRYGSAVISWRTPGRLLEFHYEDDLTVQYPVCSFAVRPLQPTERGVQPDKSIPGR